MNEQIDSAVKRVRGYWFIDGFTEIAAGALMILVAAVLLFTGSASPATFPAWFPSMVGAITIAKLGGLLVAVLALWWLKDHFTYPRTGFVRGKRLTASEVFILVRNVLLFLLLPIIALLAVSMVFISSSRVVAAMPIWFPVALGVLWAVLLVFAGEWLGLPRFRFLAALILLAGFVIGTLQWQSQAGLSQPLLLESLIRTLMSLSLLTLVCGVLLVISGLIAFLRYRKDNPSPYAENA